MQPGHSLAHRVVRRRLRGDEETSGAVDIAPVDARVRRIVDVKCPGSGEVERNHWPNLELLRPTDELKLVLADEADYRWARDLVRERRLDRLCPVHFAPVAGELEPATLAGWILRDRAVRRVQCTSDGGASGV